MNETRERGAAGQNHAAGDSTALIYHPFSGVTTPIPYKLHQTLDEMVQSPETYLTKHFGAYVSGLPCNPIAAGGFLSCPAPTYTRSCPSIVTLAKTPRDITAATATLPDNSKENRIPDEDARQNRDRVRELARNTRLRRKSFNEMLEDAISAAEIEQRDCIGVAENSVLTGFERNIADASGARHCIVFGSGSALTSSIVHLLSPGDNIVCVDNLLDRVPRYIVEPKMRISFDLVPLGNDAAMRSRLRMDKTKLLWLKTSSEPNLDLSDLRAICNLCLESGSLLVIEESFFPMPSQVLLEYGADLVIVNSMGARAVCTNDEDICSRLRLNQKSAGSLPSPFDCFLSLKVLQLDAEDPQEKGPVNSWKKRASTKLGLSLDTKVINKSSKVINAVVSPESIDVTIQRKVEAGVKAPCINVTAIVGSEVTKKPAPAQQAVVLPGETRRFELKTKDYYLTIFTKKEDGTFVVHEKNILVRASQNWTFHEFDLTKEVETLDVVTIEK